MAGAANRSGQVARQAAICIVVAAGLVTGVTLVRMALAPQLGELSPFMLYMAAVLLAGLIRGPFCGLLVMFASGILGFWLFLRPGGEAAHGAVLSLMLFWGVAAVVLATANELRVQLREAMARLSAALERRPKDPAGS